MDFNTFIQMVKDALEERLGGTASVGIHRAMKNNGIVEERIAITRQGCKTAPLVDLQPYFQQYQSGQGFDECISSILEGCRSCGKDMEGLQETAQGMRDWENVKGSVFPFLLSRERNRELLGSVAYEEYLDLAICFYIRFPHHDGIAKIKYGYLQMWGISLGTLMAQALENMGHDGYGVIPLGQLVGEMAGEPPMEVDGGFPMAVLSNKGKMYGAAGMLDTGVLDSYAKAVGGDLYILPSSLHEVILLPALGGYVAEQLKAMVSDINSECVPTEDCLSDSVYYYSCSDKTVKLVA